MPDPLARADSLGQRLASTLRDRIVRGEIPRGTHLVEDAIAESYGVSRGPVRDALTVLKQEKLVEPQRRGVHVLGLDATDVRELYAVRQALESAAVTAMVASLGGTHPTMDAGVRGMSESALPELSGEFAGHDLRFHRGIYEASGNRRLLALWESIEPLFASMLALTNREDADLGPVVADHKRLYDAILAGETGVALEILGAHLEGSRQRMLHALQSVWDGI